MREANKNGILCCVDSLRSNLYTSQV